MVGGAPPYIGGRRTPLEGRAHTIIGGTIAIGKGKERCGESITGTGEGKCHLEG